MSKNTFKKAMRSARFRKPGSISYRPPTDEQLVRFIALTLWGSGYTTTQLMLVKTMLDTDTFKQRWLDIHYDTATMVASM